MGADRKVSGVELWKAEPQHLQVRIQAVFNLVPSPSNDVCWGRVESPACTKGLRWGTVEHNLSCCMKALGDGSFCCHHEQVLKATASPPTQ